MTLAQMAKSKTLDFNALVPAVWVVLTAVGIGVPEDVVIGVLAVGNFILRFVTKQAVKEK